LGQSFPDLWQLRRGQVPAYPDAVLFPSTPVEVQKVLAVASREGIAVIPRGGGTSVVGGVSVPADPRPKVVLSLEKLAGLVSLDGRSGLATFLAGTPGPEVEKALSASGFCLGHEPQSWALSTVGGWVATRSAGHRSTALGKIEDLLAGVEVALPEGFWCLPPQPASAMGPEWRRLICGSEGKLGVITTATLRVRPSRKEDPGVAFLLPSFPAGLEACRALLQEGLVPEVLRLSDGEETALAMRAAPRGPLASLAQKLLFSLRRFSQGSLLLVGFGNLPGKGRQLRRLLRAHGGLPLGSAPWALWKRDRFIHPYFRDFFLTAGYGVDTFETAAPWSALERLWVGVKRALAEVAAQLEQQVLVLAHLSHAYGDGACLYFTFFWPLRGEEALAHWQQYKAASVEALLAAGGTVSHHHGVGRLHAPYWPKEVGEQGVRALRAMAQSLDPQGILNPGVFGL
jgi:alkyldihydroxyacetonephosphate synthase